MNLPKALKMPQLTPKDTKKYSPKSKVFVVSLVISVVLKTGFGTFLAHLECLKASIY
jgi:hypothetical protein